MAKDLFNDSVKIALQKEGWKITHDPYEIKLRTKGLFPNNLKIDLGAEKMLAAEKGAEKIAIEIKSFSGASLIYELHSLIGQYFTYQVGLEEQEPDRLLFAALPDKAYEELSPHPFFQTLIERSKMRLIIYNSDNQLITQWKYEK